MNLKSDSALNKAVTFGDLKPGDVFWHQCWGVCMKVDNQRVPSNTPFSSFAVNLVDGRVEEPLPASPVTPLNSVLHHANPPK